MPVLGSAPAFSSLWYRGVLGGMDPIAILGLFLVATGWTVLGSSLVFLFSLWVRKANDV